MIFKTAKAIRNHLVDEKKVGVYQLACADCLIKLQRGRAFKTRFKEYLQAIGINTQSCR
jgi:hypothetical protein